MIICYILLGLILIFYSTAVIYFATKGKIFKLFYHHLLKWHLPNNEEYYDGCSFHSKCKICGEKIMQDSQGNWY